MILKSLLVAPAERPDVIIDFKGYPAGTKVILYNDAPAPYPGGDPVYDFFPGFNVEENPVNASTKPGFGPNTRVLMRFNVIAATGEADPPLIIDASTDLTGGIDTFLDPTGKPTRFLTLNEGFDAYGRLIQILGNIAAPTGSPYEGAGATEETFMQETSRYGRFTTILATSTRCTSISSTSKSSTGSCLMKAYSGAINFLRTSSHPSRTSWAGRRRFRCIPAR